MAIWYSLWSFGILFSRFGMFGPRKIWQSCMECQLSYQSIVNEQPFHDSLAAEAAVVYKQGDQIGRIFAPNGRLFLLGIFFEKYRSSPNLLATLPFGKIYALIVTNKGLGYILGDFFTNSSGHPVQKRLTPDDVTKLFRYICHFY
jgi:hypothetical protein